MLPPASAGLSLTANSDDPWNQTAADNAEWLRRFKRDVGVLPADEGPGLPATDGGWNVNDGGTGFAPPYAFPKAQMGLFNDKVPIELRDGARLFETESSTANKFLQTFTTRYAAPATVFCSRELERGLTEFTEGELAKGAFPADGALQQKAREILGTPATAADDAVLLGKFKDMMQARAAGPQAGIQGQAIPELAMTDAELTGILEDMDFDFCEGAGGGPLSS